MAVNGDVESIVVDYLCNAQPLSRPERIEAAIRTYIEQLDDAAQGRVLPGWKKCGVVSKRRRKQPSKKLDNIQLSEKLDDIQRDALAFLNQKQRKRAQDNENLESTVSRETVLGAIAALRDGLSWHCENSIEGLWLAYDAVVASERFKCSPPAERLNMLHESVISTAYSTEYKRRITALLIQHERKQDRTSTSETVTEKLQRLTGMSSANAKDVAPTARGWLRFVEVWGLGGLLIPGPGHKRVLENDLSVDHSRDLQEFCRQRIPDITVKVQQMHQVVRSLLLSAVRIYEGNEEALRSGQGRLANAYRTRWEDNDSDTLEALSNLTTLGTTSSPLASMESGMTALDALAEVADSRLSDGHIEQQPSGADLTSPSCATGAPSDGLTNAPMQTSASNQDSATNAGVFSEGTATGQVQAPGPLKTASVPTALYGQAVQPQLQECTELNHSQQIIPQHDPLYGAQSRQQCGFGHAGMIMGEQSTRSGWWPTVYSPNSHEAVIPHLLQDNGLNGVDPDEWEKTVGELFTYYGDGTSYT